MFGVGGFLKVCGGDEGRSDSVWGGGRSLGACGDGLWPLAHFN